MKVKYFTTLALTLVALSAASQSIDELYNVGKSVNTNRREQTIKETTSTHSLAFSDTVEVQFITNVPANLKLNGADYGEVSTKPYRLKYGQYKAEFSAEGYQTKTKNIEPSRTQLSIYDIKLRKGNTYPFRKGLQQEVALDFGYGYSDGNHLDYGNTNKRWNFLADYVIGYRFNNWVFLGVGTGLHIYNHVTARDDYWKDIYSYKTSYYSGYKYVGLNRPGSGYLEAESTSVSVEMPLYAQLKIYFTNTRWRPFFLTSVGGRFGWNKHKDVGALFNCGLGVEYSLSERYALNLSFGYQLKGLKYDVTYRHVPNSYNYYSGHPCTSSCPYYSDRSGHYHYNVEDEVERTNELAYSFFLRLGFVF